MIFQCYFKNEQQARLFSSGPYRGFGLEPAVNANLLNGCAELADERTRVALVEYGAMLHVWRNRTFCGDDWVGFTSYRQLDKSDFVFESKEQVEELLSGYDMLAWHVWSVRNIRVRARRHIWLIGPVRTRRLQGTAAQAEYSHPLLHSFTVDVLKHFGIVIPKLYQYAPEVPFANYWVLRVPEFVAYMGWSWPIIKYALHLDHAYKKYSKSWNALDDKSKAVGYFMERLFIIWTMANALRGRWLGGIRYP